MADFAFAPVTADDLPRLRAWMDGPHWREWWGDPDEEIGDIREMIEGRLTFEDRNTLLAVMTDDVARLVLEDNRLQTLALSIMETDGAAAGSGCGQEEK